MERWTRFSAPVRGYLDFCALERRALEGSVVTAGAAKKRICFVAAGETSREDLHRSQRSWKLKWLLFWLNVTVIHGRAAQIDRARRPYRGDFRRGKQPVPNGEMRNRSFVTCRLHSPDG